MVLLSLQLQQVFILPVRSRVREKRDKILLNNPRKDVVNSRPKQLKREESSPARLLKIRET
jgi:hypothetical protein